MKIPDAVGGLITSPLCAVIVCAAGACAIWFGAIRPPAGSPMPHLAPNQATGDRTLEDGRPGAVGREKSVATATDEPQKLPSAPGASTSPVLAQPGRPSGENNAIVEEFEAQ